MLEEGDDAACDVVNQHRNQLEHWVPLLIRSPRRLQEKHRELVGEILDNFKMSDDFEGKDEARVRQEIRQKLDNCFHEVCAEVASCYKENESPKPKPWRHSIEHSVVQLDESSEDDSSVIDEISDNQKVVDNGEDLTNVETFSLASQDTDTEETFLNCETNPNENVIDTEEVSFFSESSDPVEVTDTGETSFVTSESNDTEELTDSEEISDTEGDVSDTDGEVTDEKCTPPEKYVHVNKEDADNQENTAGDRATLLERDNNAEETRIDDEVTHNSEIIDAEGELEISSFIFSPSPIGDTSVDISQSATPNLRHEIDVVQLPDDDQGGTAPGVSPLAVAGGDTSLSDSDGSAIVVDTCGEAFRARREAVELFRCLIQDESEDPQLSQNLHDTFEAAMKLSIEQFEKLTFELDPRVVTINRDALRQDLEAKFGAMRDHHQTAVIEWEDSASEELKNAVNHVMAMYEQNAWAQCDTVTSVCELETQHAEGLTSALDTFDLFIEDIREDTQQAREFLVSEIFRRFAVVKELAKENIVTLQCRALLDTFNARPLFLDATWLQKEREDLEASLVKFDEATVGMQDLQIKQRREGLEKELEASSDQRGARVVEEARDVAFRHYCNVMSLGSCGQECDIELRHAEVYASVKKEFLNNVCHMPHHLVETETNTLLQAVEEQLKEMREQIAEATDRQRAQERTRQLCAARRDARAVYDETMQQRFEQNLPYAKLEEEHTLALSQALDTYDVLTEHLAKVETSPIRVSLAEELANNFVQQRRLRSEVALTEQARLAQLTFTTRMRSAVRDSDQWPRLQAEAKQEALAIFDSSTTHMMAEDVAVHRAKLEESFDLSLMLVQEVRNTSGDAGVCVVCLAQRANIVFQPCLHLVVCELCAQSINSCSICRTYVENKLRIFN